MGRERKYPNGFMRLQPNIPPELKLRLDEYRKNNGNVSETDVVVESLNLLFSPDLNKILELQRRNKDLEAQLKQVKAELEKERSYKQQIDNAFQYKHPRVTEAENLLSTFREKLKGWTRPLGKMTVNCRLSQGEINQYCNDLRKYLFYKELSNELKREIVGCIDANSKNKLTGRQPAGSEVSNPSNSGASNSYQPHNSRPLPDNISSPVRRSDEHECTHPCVHETCSKEGDG